MHKSEISETALQRRFYIGPNVVFCVHLRPSWLNREGQFMAAPGPTRDAIK
jgi:hypothetical protein